MGENLRPTDVTDVLVHLKFSFMYIFLILCDSDRGWDIQTIIGANLYKQLKNTHEQHVGLFSLW